MNLIYKKNKGGWQLRSYDNYLTIGDHNSAKKAFTGLIEYYSAGTGEKLELKNSKIRFYKSDIHDCLFIEVYDAKDEKICSIRSNVTNYDIVRMAYKIKKHIPELSDKMEKIISLFSKK